MRKYGVCLISSIKNEHNHDLNPDMSILLHAHRKLNPSVKRTLEAFDIAGIRPCKSVRMVQVQSGGPANVGCLSKDMRNYIHSQRRLRLGDGDAEAIRKMFVKMQ